MSYRQCLGAAAFLFSIIGALFLTACCTGGEDYFTVGHGGTTPSWGEHSPISSTLFTVHWTLGKVAGGEPLEFYREGMRLEVPVDRFEQDNRTEDGCGHSMVVHYDLSTLDAGELTVVHRRSSGTGDRVNCLECPWEVYDGEEALVMTMDL